MFNHSVYTGEVELHKRQKVTIYIMIGIMYSLLTVILTYNVIKSLRVMSGLTSVLNDLKRRQNNQAANVEEIELRDRPEAVPRVVRAPTVTVIDLREPLLTD